MLKRILLSASLFLVTAGAIYPNQPLLKRAELGFAVSTNASLKTLKSTDFTSAWRTGFYTSDDSPRVIYASTNAACTLNSGNGDDGSQVKLADGNCAIAQLAAADPDVRMWGAKCDGTTDDSSKFTAAIASAKRLRIPNKACYIKRKITLSAMLVGSPSSFAWSASPETEPYTLLVDPTATITVGSGAGLEGVRVTQKGVGAPTTLRQALTAYAGFTGTAITCSASALPTDTSDISFHQVFITGFNTAILKQSCDRLFLQDVKIASTNGITAQQCYDTCYWEKVELWPFLGSFASVQDQNSTVSDAANNGSGLIRLTLSAAPSTPLVTGDKVSVARVGGVPNATGRWTIAVVNPTTIDLQGSTWAGTYTSGGNVRLGLIIPGTGVNLANGSYEIHHLTVYGWDTDMAAGPAITESWCSDCWLDHYPAAGDPTPTSLAINAGVGTFSFTGFMYSSGKAVDLKAGALKITRSNIGGNVDSGAAVINVANAGSALLMGQSAINSAVTSGTASVITVDSAFTRVDLEGVVDYTVGDYFTIPPGPACGRFFQDGIAGPCAWTPSLLFGGASTGWVYTSSGVYTQTLNGAFINTEAKVVVSAKGTATGPVTITGLPSNTVKLTGTCSSPVNSGMAGLTGPLQGFTTLGVASIQLDNQGATGTGGLTHANFTATSNFYLNCSFIAGQ